MTHDYDREREARDYVNRYVRVGWENHIEPPRALLELLARAEAHGRQQAAAKNQPVYDTIDPECV